MSEEPKPKPKRRRTKGAVAASQAKSSPTTVSGAVVAALERPIVASIIALASLALSGIFGARQWFFEEAARAEAELDSAPFLMIESFHLNPPSDAAHGAALQALYRNTSERPAFDLDRRVRCGETLVGLRGSILSTPDRGSLGPGTASLSLGCHILARHWQLMMREGRPYFIAPQWRYRTRKGTELEQSDCFGVVVSPTLTQAGQPVFHFLRCEAWTCTDDLCRPSEPIASSVGQ